GRGARPRGRRRRLRRPFVPEVVLLSLELGPAHVRFTGRAEGDMGHGGAFVASVAPEVEARRRAVVDAPWTWLRQVHGDAVVIVSGPGDGAGTPADAAVTSAPNSVLAVLAADCAPVALSTPEGVVAAVHAGWRGLMAGVVEQAVATVRAVGGGDVAAVLGPCIHPECYEFGDADLDAVAARLGPEVRGRTRTGSPAL